MHERDIYEYIYNNPNRYGGYGKSNHGKDSYKIIDKKISNVRSILDVGCGFNDFLKKYNDSGIDYFKLIGADIACPGADIISDIVNLPFSNKVFDLVTSFDVLEHIDPSRIKKSLAELSRVSKKFIFSISYVPAKINVPFVPNIHKTIWEEKKWTDIIGEYASNIYKDGRYIWGEWDNDHYRENNIILARDIAINENFNINKRCSAICFLFYRSIENKEYTYLNSINITKVFVNSIQNLRWKYSVLNAWVLYLISLNKIENAYDISKLAIDNKDDLELMMPNEIINMIKILLFILLYEIKFKFKTYSISLDELNRVVRDNLNKKRGFNFDDIDFWGYWYIINRVLLHMKTSDVNRIKSGLFNISSQLGRCSIYTNLMLKSIS